MAANEDVTQFLPKALPVEVEDLGEDKEKIEAERIRVAVDKVAQAVDEKMKNEINAKYES